MFSGSDRLLPDLLDSFSSIARRSNAACRPMPITWQIAQCVELMLLIAFRLPLRTTSPATRSISASAPILCLCASFLFATLREHTFCHDLSLFCMYFPLNVSLTCSLAPHAGPDQTHSEINTCFSSLYLKQIDLLRHRQSGFRPLQTVLAY